MNHLLIVVLASFSVPAMALAVYLGLRLHRKEAELKAVQVRLQVYDGGESPPESSEDITVTDQFLYDRCCRFMMERRPFLVVKYTVQDLANSMFVNRYYLSKTINKFSGKNFKAYVNYYRVMYAMELFRANMSLRIEDLAELSGFGSESSFLSSFRSVMGEPPSYWCNRIRKKYRVVKK